MTDELENKLVVRFETIGHPSVIELNTGLGNITNIWLEYKDGKTVELYSNKKGLKK